ncbi:MAG TPA: YgiQ family radical SAM protein, partial [Tepidisphaeraceae bacterium]|nr:YgiQ family radical SAM protein [Tepidisphaeraceae bacterium]
MLAQPKFLPTTRQEMQSLGWDELDILLVSGDAYVDHPSFGVAILGRWLVHHGYRVGIIAQPRWTDTQDISRLGRPRLFAGVTAGALDSMLAHYTAFRKKRSDDAYTPGGQAGARPNRACLVYSSLIKQAFPGLPIVLGGIEASLRRISHYDFWTDKIRRSILIDAKADLLLYGMAERGIVEAARALETNTDCDVTPISGSVSIQNQKSKIANALTLPSHEEILADPRKLMEATLQIEQHVHHANQTAIQPVENRFLILTPPHPLNQSEMDVLYSLPFTREPHPSYKQPIPAADMIRFSITAHRGCAGGCSFCALAAHQGRGIRSRSESSILSEARTMTSHAKWTGSITDVGGPSANMWGGYCADDPTRCQRASCLYPNVCPHFVVDQMKMVSLLRQLKQLPRVKHVRIASGIRHDLALKDREYIRALVREFVGGQLKIAPEHLSDQVLRLMRKPGQQTFEQFLEIFEQECKAAGKEQYIIPYLITAVPGCTDRDMRFLSDWLSRRHWRPQQIQCFIPLPGTVAAAMYHAGVDTHGKPISIPKSDAARLK